MRLLFVDNIMDCKVMEAAELVLLAGRPAGELA